MIASIKLFEFNEKFGYDASSWRIDVSG